MQIFKMFLTTLALVTSQASFSQTSAPDASESYIPHFTLAFITIDCAPDAVYTTATGINNAGKVVGNCATNSLHGYEWTPGTVRHVDFPRAAATGAADINSLGEVAGIYDLITNGNAHGFQLDKSGYTTIDASGAIQTVVIGTNTFGEMVGYWNDKNYNIYGFLYSKGAFTPISVPGSLYTIPNGLNSSAVVGSYRTSTTSYAFMLQGGVLTSFDFPGAMFSYAYSINTSGEVIGLYEDSKFQYHGFLWRDGAFVETFDLQDGAMMADGYTRLSLNDMRQIVGTYVDDKGIRHGFLANLPKLN
jgi:probable HAF family extracellular repeat protein